MSQNAIRCVNTLTNKVKYFPKEICYNLWWQKNTKFIPQELEIKADELTIINQSIMSESAAESVENESDHPVADSDLQQTPKQRKRKKKTEDGNI